MPPEPTRSRAVLIGTTTYSDPSWHGRQLDAVRANVTDLAAVLCDERVWGLPAAHRTVVLDPQTPEQLILPVRAAVAEATDTLLVYYAGHGFLSIGDGAAELQLTVSRSVDGDPLNAVRYRQLRAELSRSRAQRRIVVLDCCFAGAAIGTMGTAAADQTPIAGAYVLAAVPPFELAVAPRGATHTAFTGELIGLLRGGVADAGPELTLDEIYGHLWRRLAARNLPTPCRSDLGTVGGLALVRNRFHRPEVTADVLAVDFGTSNTTAVLRLASGAINPLLFDNSTALPSAVSVSGDGQLRVGRDAIHTARIAPAAFEANPKRRIDDATLSLAGRPVAVLDAVAAVLGRVAAEAARRLGDRPARLVLTHPHTWGPQRKAVLEAAALKAGLPRPEMVSEPMAATAYYTARASRRVKPGQIVVLYDFGGGTFDVSTVRRCDADEDGADGWRVVRCAGLDAVGGVNVDEAVLGWIGAQVDARDPVAWQRMCVPVDAEDQRLRRSLVEDARTAKEQLSWDSSVRIPVPVIDDDLVLTRERFEDLARDLVEQTVRLTASTVACSDAGPDQLAGVVLIGGSSRIPLVRRMLEQATGIVPEALPEPELVVAEGALHRLAPAGPPPPVPPPATARIRLVVRHLRDRWNIGTGVGFGALTAGLVAAVAPEPGSALLPAVVAGGGVFGFAYALNVVLALRRSDDALRHRP